MPDSEVNLRSESYSEAAEGWWFSLVQPRSASFKSSAKPAPRKISEMAQKFWLRDAGF